MEAVTTYFFDD